MFAYNGDKKGKLIRFYPAAYGPWSQLQSIWLGYFNVTIDTIKEVGGIGMAKTICCECGTIHGSIIKVSALVDGIPVKRIMGNQILWECVGWQNDEEYYWKRY